MTLRHTGIALAVALILPFLFTSAASAHSVTCTGTPATTSIAWSASAQNGVQPFAFVWGNGATGATQTVNAAAGVHTMNIQATDASTTVATSTCSATVASTTATSTNPALDQLRSLLAQIEGLKKQIALLLAGQVIGGGTNASSTPQGCFGFWRDLKRGDEGDDVRELQHELAKTDPTLFPPGLVNGTFGPKTEAALKMFQRRFGIDLSGTGFFGMKSRGHFAAQCSRGDKDNDGIPNIEDADDDNDGVNDADDRFPFNPKATTTPLRDKIKADDDDHDRSGKGKGPGGNSGKGNGDDDEDDN